MFNNIFSKYYEFNNFTDCFTITFICSLLQGREASSLFYQKFVVRHMKYSTNTCATIIQLYQQCR